MGITGNKGVFTRSIIIESCDNSWEYGTKLDVQVRGT